MQIRCEPADPKHRRPRRREIKRKRNAIQPSAHLAYQMDTFLIRRQILT
jgi:hypothetical protein